MKTKKSKRSKRESSSSSSTSSSSTSPERKTRTRTRSRSRTPSKNTRTKQSSSSTSDSRRDRDRQPTKDMKSKWDSPEQRIEKHRLSESKKPERTHPHEGRQRSNNRTDTSRRNTDDRHRNDRRNDGQGDFKSRNRSRSPTKRNRSRSPHNRRNRSRSPYRSNNRRRRRSRSASFDHSKAVWGKSDQNAPQKEAPKEKEKPNFGLSGKLTEETNTYRGVVIKYSEPPEARKPMRRWRLYPFKGEKAMPTLYIHRESAYLVGRDRKVVDLPVDHPSCSKQHAALQYRLVQFTREDGSVGKRVRPYLIDLESANGTYINNKKIEPKKYVELLDRDVIKFGFSTREYVLLHENSKDDAKDDDVQAEHAVQPPEPAPTTDVTT